LILVTKEKKQQQANKLEDMLKPFLTDGLLCVIRQSIHLLCVCSKKTLFPALSQLGMDEETRRKSEF